MDTAAPPTIEPIALVDGTRVPLADAALAVTDEGVARGDGAFETLGVWNGQPFRVPDHMARLASSLERLLLPSPPVELLAAEVAALCDGVSSDAALRIYVTGSGTRVLTLAPQPDRTAPAWLVAQPAPWIRPVGSWGPTGAKTMSYAPNMAASRAARAAGGDEALLVSLEGVVCEGPTFCVFWVASGVLCTPDPELGLVDSISRRIVLELAADAGIDTAVGRWTLAELTDVTEFLVCSSVRPLLAVGKVADLVLDGPTPVRDRLAPELEALRRETPGGPG